MGTNSAVYSARGGAAVTKRDITILTNVRALDVGGAGDVALTFVDGSTATLVGVLAGTILPVQVTKVMSTGTTATNIVALT